MEEDRQEENGKADSLEDGLSLGVDWKLENLPSGCLSSISCRDLVAWKCYRVIHQMRDRHHGGCGCGHLSLVAVDEYIERDRRLVPLSIILGKTHGFLSQDASDTFISLVLHDLEHNSRCLLDKVKPRNFPTAVYGLTSLAIEFQLHRPCRECRWNEERIMFEDESHSPMPHAKKPKVLHSVSQSETCDFLFFLECDGLIRLMAIALTVRATSVPSLPPPSAPPRPTPSCTPPPAAPVVEAKQKTEDEKRKQWKRMKTTPPSKTIQKMQERINDLLFDASLASELIATTDPARTCDRLPVFCNASSIELHVSLLKRIHTELASVEEVMQEHLIDDNSPTAICLANALKDCVGRFMFLVLK